jgi:hypothetical protein
MTGALIPRNPGLEINVVGGMWVVDKWFKALV